VSWKNRIVDHGEEVPDQLLANPLNWRTHPKFQQRALSAVLEEVGIVQQVIVNKRTGHLVDGHLRVTLAMRRDEPSIPVIYVDLSEEEEKKILATFDPLSALAQTDQEVLDQLLEGMNGSSSADLEKLLNKLKTKALSPTKEIEGNKEFKVELGQTWVCGDHRIICGDSMHPEVITQIMGEHKVQAVVTDPPYAIYGSSTGIASEVADDKMVRPFFEMIFRLCRERTVPFGHIYVHCDWRSWAAIIESAKRCKITPKNLIVWDKGDGGFGAMYQNCHEFIGFFANDSRKSIMGHSKSGGGARQVHGRPNIIRVGRTHGDARSHNAAKPMQLVEELIQDGSDRGGVVADWFLGSGTTMLVCEIHGRKCIGVEIEPEYVSLCLSKWQSLTGKKPKLLDSRQSLS